MGDPGQVGDGSTVPEGLRHQLVEACPVSPDPARPEADGALLVRYVNLPARMLRALPAGVDLRTAALIEPAAVAWHAVARAGDVAGKSVLVIGCGPIGALAVAVLKRAGAARITAVDVHAKPLEIAAAVGADQTLRAGDTDAIGAVQADVVIESSGSHHGLASAIQGAGRGGTVVMVGLLPTGPQPVLISLAITRELDLRGSFRFNNEIDDVITALADRTLNIGPVITHEYPLSQGLEAFETARNSAASGKVLLNFQPAGAVVQP